MQPASFPCPCCAVPLRINDDQFVGRTIDCPDCGTTLLIVVEPPGTVRAEVFVASDTSGSASDISENAKLGRVRETADGSVPVISSQEASNGIVSTQETRLDERHRLFPSGLTSILSAWRQGLRNPVVLAWTLAGSSTLLLLMTLFSLSSTPARNDSLQMQQPADNSFKPLPPREPRRDDSQLLKPPSGTPEGPAQSPQSKRSATEMNSQPQVTQADPDSTTHVAKSQSSGGNPLVVPDTKAPATSSMARNTSLEITAVSERSASQESKIPGPPNLSPPVPQRGLDVDAETAAKRVRAALAQPITGFEQAKPVPFRELLVQVEDMAGVPIQFDEREIGPSTLDQSVSFKLQATTVEAILQELCRQVDLTWKIHGSVILLHKKSSAGTLDLGDRRTGTTLSRDTDAFRFGDFCFRQFDS